MYPCAQGQGFASSTQLPAWEYDPALEWVSALDDHAIGGSTFVNPDGQSCTDATYLSRLSLDAVSPRSSCDDLLSPTSPYESDGSRLASPPTIHEISMRRRAMSAGPRLDFPAALGAFNNARPAQLPATYAFSPPSPAEYSSDVSNPTPDAPTQSPLPTGQQWPASTYRRSRAFTSPTGNLDMEDTPVSRRARNAPLRPFLRDSQGNYHRKRVSEMTDDELERFRAFNRVVGQRQREKSKLAMDALVDRLRTLDNTRGELLQTAQEYRRHLRQLHGLIVRRQARGEMNLARVLTPRHTSAPGTTGRAYAPSFAEPAAAKKQMPTVVTSLLTAPSLVFAAEQTYNPQWY